MSDLNGLREHGITTTKADYWVHFFPLAREVYWYRVELCRAFLALKNEPLTPGRSRDGTVTGSGYLIPKASCFVHRAEVDQSLVASFDWSDTTDRQFGFAGEAVVAALIEKRVVHFPAARVAFMRSEADQNSSRDFSVTWFKPLTVEVKTDRYSQSPNLYVQTHEGGHRPHQVRTEGALVERITSAPPMSRGGAA